MAMKQALRRVIATVALTMTVALYCATAARADSDINACFNMIGDAVKTYTDVVGNEAAFLGDPNCTAVVSSNTIMFGIVAGIVTAVNAAGAFGGHDYEACNNAINSAIASAIVAALSAALDDGSPLGALIPDEDAREQIKTIAVNLATSPEVIDQVNEWLSKVPVVGQMIGMMSCACRISAAVVQGAIDVVETVKTAVQCEGFVEDCINSPIKCAGTLFESGIEAISDAVDAVSNFVECDIFGTCSQSPPPPPSQVDCMGGATLSGDVQNFGPYGDFVKVSKTSNQFCTCGGNMKWTDNNGTWSCGCGQGLVVDRPGLCTCPPGQTGKPGGGCEPCPEGSVGLHGSCTCQKQNSELARVGGKLVCQCPPAMRDVAGKCVIPCSSLDGRTRVLLADGSCCDPKRVSACGQCCRTANCMDAQMPVGGGSFAGCCPPGQIQVAGGCAPPGRVTRAGYVCQPGSFVTGDGLDCYSKAKVNYTPRQVDERGGGKKAIVRQPEGSSGSAGVSGQATDCPPGQTLINGRCVFATSGEGATTLEPRSTTLRDADRPDRGKINSGFSGSAGTRLDGGGVGSSSTDRRGGSSLDRENRISPIRSDSDRRGGSALEREQMAPMRTEQPRLR